MSKLQSILPISKKMDFILIEDIYNHNTFGVQKYTHLN